MILNSHKEMDSEITLRPANKGDECFLFDLRNDPTVRRSAFSTGIITWNNHIKWFSNKLKSSKTGIYIIEKGEGNPLGQVRFDIDSKKQAEINITVCRDYRGKGFGSKGIGLACKKIFSEYDVKEIIAHIKLDNKRSIKSFLKAGFNNRGTVNFRNNQCIKMTFQNRK